jgi:hypothetical protein
MKLKLAAKQQLHLKSQLPARTLKVSAFPTISSNYFTLSIESGSTEKLAARVYDVKWKDCRNAEYR